MRQIAVTYTMNRNPNIYTPWWDGQFPHSEAATSATAIPEPRAPVSGREHHQLELANRLTAGAASSRFTHAACSVGTRAAPLGARTYG